MMKLLFTMLAGKDAKKPRRPSPGARRDTRRVRPEIERLERRDTPTVTYHGGALLPHVEAQAMFYGSDWTSNPYFGQAIQLSGFLGTIVNSSYMDMLSNAGYRVGRGTARSGDVYGVNVDKTQYLNDTQIQSALASELKSGRLGTPDSNRLFVVFVEDNVAIQTSTGTSVSNFLGYHSVFQTYIYVDGGSSGISYIYSYDIHYAVVAYTGGSIPLSTGTVPNATRPWLSSAFDNMTETASHELAEAVTNPNDGYNKPMGWNDDSQALGEIGDICANQTVFLNGYAVQRIVDQNDQAMTPAGATSIKQVNFILKTDGTLYLSNSSGLTYLTSNVASISDQGVDNYGHAMVDVVLGNGDAYEYHEGTGLIFLSSNVRQAKAGQGVSYVLFTNGTVSEYKDGSSWVNRDNNVQSIDAGTDQHGVNMMTEVRLDRYYQNFMMRSQLDGYEFSDSSGRHLIASYVKSMSAGQQGFMGYVTTGAEAWWYSEATAFSSDLGSGVAAVTAGTDQYGNYMIDLLYASGALSEWRQGSGWTLIGNSVAVIGKAHAGVLDFVFNYGDAYLHNSSGWYYLASNAKTAA